MNIRQACIEEANFLESVFRGLEKQVPPPAAMPWKDGFLARYLDKLPIQALLLKFARQISGLNALDVLLKAGFAQEQAVIQRTLDEIGEDIIFLSIAICQNQFTPLHHRYLDAFWKEEFTADHWTEWTLDREMIPRKKIRAYINRAYGQTDPSTADKAGYSISKTYSGFVHAASPHVMDMYDGSPAKFMLRGLLGTEKMRDYIEDALNYFYRGLLSASFVSKAFGDDQLASSTYSRIQRFEQRFRSFILP